MVDTKDQVLAKFRDALSSVMSNPDNSILTIKEMKAVALHNLYLTDYATYRQYMIMFCLNQ